MAIEDRSSWHWRLPVLLFLIAFIGAVIFSVVYRRSGEEAPRVTVPLPAKAHLKNGVIASSAAAPTVPPKVNTARQKAGPPDPGAQRTAAAAADTAARAAADLANK
jgi:hypothetical protein